MTFTRISFGVPHSDLDDAAGWSFRVGKSNTGHAVAIASRPLEELSVHFVDPFGASAKGEVDWLAGAPRRL